MKCFICRQDAQHLFRYRGTKYSVLRCPRCRILLIDPLPDESDLDSLYQDEDYGGSLFLDPRWQLWNSRVHLRPALDRLEKAALLGRLLDVGCADGLLLRLARDRVWETWGVEVNRFYSGLAREKHSLQVFTGTLEAARFASDFFDAVNVSHLLEHLGDPLRLLAEVRRVLKPGGLLHVSAPTLDAQTYRALRLIPHPGVAAKLICLLGSVNPPEHVITFSTDGFKAMLSAAGFKVVAVAYTSNTRPLFASWRDWLLKVAAYPFLRAAGSGLHVAVLCKKS